MWLLLRFQNGVLYASVKERERRLLINKKDSEYDIYLNDKYDFYDPL